VKLQWSAPALADLDRFSEFLQTRYPHLAGVVGAEIIRKARILESHPDLGRPLSGRSGYREFALRVAGAMYVFRYLHDGERLVMLRVFHGREDRPALP
jgi:plasmid stabilization system protein ParE